MADARTLKRKPVTRTESDEERDDISRPREPTAMQPPERAMMVSPIRRIIRRIRGT